MQKSLYRRSRLLVLCSILGVLASARTPAAASRPPNFVIIFADDLGYSDVGVYGAQGYSTPNIDRMAAEGIRFTDFYAAANVCTPSRAALMTGSYPNRVGLPNVLGPRAQIGINATEITIAELLKNLVVGDRCADHGPSGGLWRCSRPGTRSWSGEKILQREGTVKQRIQIPPFAGPVAGRTSPPSSHSG